MPSQVNYLKVFAASPSDIKDERIILKEVIDDINKVFSTRFGVGFDLIKWETDTYPSVGEDAQSVINDQIRDDYDVFIGLLWTRIGTPTKREASGTIEEFKRAHRRAIDEPESIRLMIYFRTSPISPDEIDGEQISKVQEFKKNIGDLGVYWWQYNTIRDFERHVRLHLQNVLLDFGSKWGQKIKANLEIKVIDKINVVDINSVEKVLDVQNDSVLKNNTDTEENVLRLKDSITKAFNQAFESVTVIKNLMQLLNTKTNARANELEDIRNDPNRKEKALAVLGSYSSDIDNFVSAVEPELFNLSKSFRDAIDYFVELISSEMVISGELEEQTKRQIYMSLDETKSNCLEAQKSIGNFRDINQKLPSQPLQMEFSKAQLLRTLNNLQNEFQAQVSLVTLAQKVSKSTLG